MRLAELTDEEREIISSKSSNVSIGQFRDEVVVIAHGEISDLVEIIESIHSQDSEVIISREE